MCDIDRTLVSQAPMHLKIQEELTRKAMSRYGLSRRKAERTVSDIFFKGRELRVPGKTAVVIGNDWNRALVPFFGVRYQNLVEKYRAELRPVPSAVEFVKRAAEKGVLAFFTSTPRSYQERKLELLGFELPKKAVWFAPGSSKAYVGKGKPETARGVLDKLGIKSKDKVFIFGDMPADLVFFKNVFEEARKRGFGQRVYFRVVKGQPTFSEEKKYVGSMKGLVENLPAEMKRNVGAFESYGLFIRSLNRKR